jgi:hypothetical protein
MSASLETQIYALQDRITDAFLSTLAVLAPLPVEEFGTLIRSTLPHHHGNDLSQALGQAGWLTATRNGQPVDLANGSPEPGDIIHFSTPTPCAASLRAALQ